MNRKCTLLIGLIVFMYFPLFLTGYAADEDKKKCTFYCELIALCHQATVLCLEHEKFVLPTYPEKHTLVTTFRGPKDNDVFGFISETPTKIFIVFRGTQTRDDVKRDFDCVRVPFHLVPNSGYVHQGFLTAYTKVGKNRLCSLRHFILKTLSQLDSTKKLYVTGHSMGGALATLCTLDIAANSSFHQPNLYTFASPRVGNSAFVEKFNATIETSERIKNEYDYIPSTPLMSMGYRHVKGKVSIAYKTNNIINHHRIVQAYLPGMISTFTETFDQLFWNNPIDLIPPLPKLKNPIKN